MKVGFFTVNPNFAGPLLKELRSRHEVRCWINSNSQEFNLVNLHSLLEWSDVAFFEFCQSPLPEATYFQGIDTPIVARLQGIEIYHYMENIKWNRVKLLITSIPQMMRLSKLNLPLPRVEVLPLGTDPDFFTPPENRIPGKCITTIGLVSPRKRVYTTIQTLAPILGDWKLYIRGEFSGFRDEELVEYKSHILELIETLGVEDSVKFIPGPPGGNQEEYRAFLRAMDIVVSNSTQEGYHVSVFDAMACGVHPLINCWLGADRLFPSYSIFRSQTELLQKVVQWDLAPVSRKLELAKLAREHVIAGGHDNKLVAKRIVDLLEEVASGKKE